MGVEAEKEQSMGARIHVPKTSELVANKIRTQIVRGALHEGDSLPPEGVLMEELGISRPTLREAFRILEAEGLISVVRGSRSGAKVHKPSVDLVSRYAGYVLEANETTVADLYQARLAIEPAVVRWLANDKGNGQLEPLRRLIGEMKLFAERQDNEAFIGHVELFHQALVQASGVKTMIFLSRMLLNLADRHQRAFQLHHDSDSAAKRAKGQRTGIKSYTKLVNLIEAGDVDAAVAHWRLHLRNAIQTWTDFGEGSKIVNSIDA